MSTMNWKAIITAVFCVFLTTACSKKLMPPEIETSGSASDGTESTASSSERDFGPEDSGFFNEESSLGSSSESSLESGTRDSFSNNPFDGNSGGGNSGSSESGLQESRMKSFKASTNLKDIHFKFDQYDLDGNSRSILKNNADFLKSNPSLHVEIQGHCDERGTNNYNIALGERRAHSTKKYLVSQGVDSSNVHVISYGEEKPFCFSNGETCWFQNRRAHFMVSK
jgi:peptidoglycan-associated lipoprotein